MCTFPACARCGCPREAHLHYSRATRDCALCGVTRCAWYRHPHSPAGLAVRAHKQARGLLFLARVVLGRRWP